MHENFPTTFVNVILPLPLGKYYTYRVPEEIISAVGPGKRAVVQFGRKKIYTALIHTVHHTPPSEYVAKNIIDVLDESPIVNDKMFLFWSWISSYYMCAPGDVMQAALPSSLRPESETRIILNPENDAGLTELSDKEFMIVEALTIKNQLTLDEIAEVVQQKNIMPLIKSLYFKELILLSEEMKDSYKPKTVSCIRLEEKFADEKNLELLFGELEKKHKQLDVLMAFIHLQNEHEHIEKNLLEKFSKGGSSSIKTLINKGVFTEYKLAVDRLQKQDQIIESFDLNESQEEALNLIKTNFQSKDVVLLHGVTSSGKTHVYVKMMEETLACGKQILYLLPEIALTSQIVMRIRKYFGDSAMAFHSRFSQNERVEMWQRIQRGDPVIVIGARSAVFLPFSNLGLVIVDEEHEGSYKQQDPAPRYHARDAAVFLAHLHECKTILGSATPSFETYYNSITNKYGHVTIKSRFGNMELPKIITANIAEESRTKTMKGSFTSVLIREIESALANHQQVILFQNRRGYAPLQECGICRWIPRCIHCDISLTYHKATDQLQCHYCGYHQKLNHTCPACGSQQLNLKGIGTEKIEDELKVLLPHTRISRLDLDSGKSKNGFEKIIRGFENHDYDILVGTQMLGKGLDFEKVSLVGIINADHLLHFPDFRAHERAFQLMSQVSGRAGRRDKRGMVVIQTSSPEHHVIQEVIGHKYENLFNDESESRKNYGYPPYSRLVRIVLKHKHAKTLTNAAYHLENMLHARFGDRMSGPVSPLISRIRSLYIKEILIKFDRQTPFLSKNKVFIRECMIKLLENEHFKQIYVYADVDPS